MHLRVKFSLLQCREIIVAVNSQTALMSLFNAFARSAARRRCAADEAVGICWYQIYYQATSAMTAFERTAPGLHPSARTQFARARDLIVACSLACQGFLWLLDERRLPHCGPRDYGFRGQRMTYAFAPPRCLLAPS